MNEKQSEPVCIFCGNPVEIKSPYSSIIPITTAICSVCKYIRLLASSELSTCPFCLHSLYLIATDKTDITICSNPDCPEYSIHPDRLERGDVIGWKDSRLLILERWISFWCNHVSSDRIEVDSPAYPRLITLLSAIRDRLH